MSLGPAMVGPTPPAMARDCFSKVVLSIGGWVHAHDRHDLPRGFDLGDAHLGGTDLADVALVDHVLREVELIM
jgi:hypothetical protein